MKDSHVCKYCDAYPSFKKDYRLRNVVCRLHLKMVEDGIIEEGNDGCWHPIGTALIYDEVEECIIK
jgi:hypothetical protein